MEKIESVDDVICNLIRQIARSKKSRTEITPELDLRKHLAMDSIDLLSFIFTIDEKLGIDMFQYADRLADAVLLSDLIAVAKDAKAASAPTGGNVP